MGQDRRRRPGGGATDTQERFTRLIGGTSTAGSSTCAAKYSVVTSYKIKLTSPVLAACAKQAVAIRSRYVRFCARASVRRIVE